MCAIAAMHCGVWVPEGPAGYTSQFLHVSMAISVDHGLSGVSWISSGAVGFLSRNRINLPYGRAEVWGAATIARVVMDDSSTMQF